MQAYNYESRKYNKLHIRLLKALGKSQNNNIIGGTSITVLENKLTIKAN